LENLAETLATLASKKPLTEKEAARRTGLDCVTRKPHASYDWLRCQIGRWSSTPAYCHEKYGKIERSQVFHLLGYGSTWREAVEMVRQTGRAACSST